MGGWETEEAWIEGDWDDLLAVRLYFLDIDTTGLPEHTDSGSIRYFAWDTSRLDIWETITPLSREHPDVAFVFSYESHSRHGFVYYQTTVKNGLLTRMTETSDFEPDNLPPIVLERYEIADIHATAVVETLDGDEVVSRQDMILLHDMDVWLTVPKSADGEFLPEPQPEPDPSTVTF